jgi:hypothetical protein
VEGVNASVLAMGSQLNAMATAINSNRQPKSPTFQRQENTEALRQRLAYEMEKTNISREFLIASLLIAGALVFYAPVVKISPANTAICAGGKYYPWRTDFLCAGDNYHTAGASKQNALGISPGGPTSDGPAPVHCYPRRID